MAKANNPDFQEVLEKITELHNKKSNDYAEDADYYSNFKFAAFVADTTVDQVFRMMLGIKLARLKELKKGKTPNFESIEDTTLDLANYSCIYASYKGPQHITTSLFTASHQAALKDFMIHTGDPTTLGLDSWLNNVETYVKRIKDANTKEKKS